MALDLAGPVPDPLDPRIAPEPLDGKVVHQPHAAEDHDLRIGLVTELVPVSEIKERAQALGEDLAAQPRQAVRSMLEVVVGHETRTLAESMEDEKNAVAANRGTADAQEGILAFMEKRKPVFNQNCG